jgi:WD40 repeat protein
MSDSRSDTPSVVERTRTIKADAPIVAAHFLDSLAVFVLGEEMLLSVTREGVTRQTPVHDGAILCSAADAGRIITGGDDGKVVTSAADGSSDVLAIDSKRRWIDHVARAANGAVAWSGGKQVFARSRRGAERTVEVPSTVGGLAFAPKGFRIAIAHYNGATLWFPETESDPERLEWRGSHLALTMSPDGRFLVTAMQEPALHGWRISDRKDMRMSGYQARVRSLSWTAGGKWLATSGSNQLILWPFQTRDGPMGKGPRILAPATAQAQIVACHPKAEIVAVGYADGLVLLVRVEDGAEIMARKPDTAPVSALAWSKSGDMLAVGTETGDGGVIDLP